MPKSKKTLTVPLPRYQADRTAWRTAIFNAAREAKKEQEVTYAKTEKFDIVVSLYLSGSAAQKHDVDNRLKDVLDGLQGALAGEGKPKRYRKGRVIRNDKYIYRALIEKFVTPKKYANNEDSPSSGGRVTIRRWTPRAKPR